jgi:hypothetical protein
MDVRYIFCRLSYLLSTIGDALSEFLSLATSGLVGPQMDLDDGLLNLRRLLWMLLSASIFSLTPKTGC